MTDEHADTVDVVIMGGGLAGLGLAWQLKASQPGVRVTVVEKRKQPVPEAAWKVGESTLPIAARYLSEVLGLREHLQTRQIRKMGMRFFGPAENGNHDIAHRPEIGLRRPPPLPSYQLDHGRLENVLGERVVEAGIELLDDTRITAVEIGEPHEVTVVTRDGPARTLRPRYLVDASGRAAILKRKLKLEKPAPHSANAAWFRIADRLAVDDWSSEPEWKSRVPGAERWRSTVHLHGAGYWIWLIPLASGSTSVGLVADPELVPFERMRRFELLLDWLREHEPQLAAEVQRRSDLLQDFKTRKDYPKGCERVFSPERWFITGDAGIFHDPLYSPGLDFISIANTLITDLIRFDREGRPDAAEQIATADGMFRVQAELVFGLYSGQYKLFGNHEIVSVKTVWEAIAYFALGAPISFATDAIEDPTGLMMKIGADLGRYAAVTRAFHNLLQDWNVAAGDSRTVGMMSAVDEIMDGMQVRLVESSRREEDVIDLIGRNVRLMKDTFAEIFEHVAASLGFEPPEDRAWVENDERLFTFRLTDLPHTGEPGFVAPPPSTAGLCWATRDDPEGALNDHMSAWPRLVGRNAPYGDPARVQNALAALSSA